MKAEAMSFTFLGNEGMVKIPFFQRGYVWEQTNWGELLDDLMDENKSHFLGSIIMKQQDRQSGKPKEVLIIDGQQRLTTLSVLVKALYDTFTDETKENCTNAIRSHLFYKKNQTDKDYMIKIQHSHIDAKYYKQVIEANSNPDVLASIADDSNKILRCYKYFVEELNKRTEEERKTLFDRILDSENKMLVLIDLYKEDKDEQAIFDTINSAGVRLSGADVIKNAMFQKAIELFNNEDEVIAIYNRNWKDVFIADEETIAFWETQHSTGRLTRDNIEILLHSIAVIKGVFDPDKNTLSDLSSLYKAKLAEIKTKDALKVFIDEISEYAKLYREKILSFEKSTLFSFDNPIQRLFHVLEVFEISTFHPFILFLMRKYFNNEQKLLDILFKLERLVMLRMLTKEDIKRYNKYCKEFIDNENLLDERINEIDESKIPSGLQYINNKNAALILFWIELFRRRNNNKYDTNELKYNYSLEHIMPQKWEQYWSNIPTKKNINGENMTVEEAKRDRADKIYWIGNMTLLKSPLNTSLRNYLFEKKIDGDGKKKGMRPYAELSITKDDIIAEYDSGQKTWDEERIINRTGKLLTEIQAIWSSKM